MWLTFWRKMVFVNIYPLLLVQSKKVVKTNPNFPQDLPLSNMVRKTNFLIISILFLVTFMSKKKFLSEFPQKLLKTTERHNLAVCGSLCGEKRFLLIFIPFYWFDQKQLFKQILIFLRIFPFQTW